MKLEHGNPDVGSSIELSETELDYRLTLKDCERSIIWRFSFKNKELIIKSIIKSERAIVELQRLQEKLKEKL
jgi:hypothetical protein